MKRLFNADMNSLILRAAGLIHLVYGLFVVFFPQAFFTLIDVQNVHYPQVWQCVGLVYIAFSVGFLIASFDSAKHWLIVLVGLVLKILMTLGFVVLFLDGRFPLYLGSLLFLTDIFWIIPFYFVLEAAYDHHTYEESSPKKFHDLIRYVRTNQGETLFDLSKKERLLLVFIRQFGCIFCRENMAELARLSKLKEKKKLKLVFVHMSDPTFADEFFNNYFEGQQITHISDPGRVLYKSLDLKRGSFFQLFGPMTWLRGAWIIITKRIFQGETEGDPLQLGGIFVMEDGQITYEQKTTKASNLFELSSIPE